MSKKIAVHLAEGFEEMEAIIPIDIWRRAGYDVVIVSVYKEKIVKGNHDIPIVADMLFEDQQYDNIDMLYLPGGIPGAYNLNSHEGLKDMILNFNKKKKVIGAICAAPLILGQAKILIGKKVTCYPGFENELEGADITGNYFEKDENIFTGKGPGAALKFAFEIVKYFDGEEKASDLSNKMQVV